MVLLEKDVKSINSRLVFFIADFLFNKYFLGVRLSDVTGLSISTCPSCNLKTSLKSSVWID